MLPSRDGKVVSLEISLGQVFLGFTEIHIRSMAHFTNYGESKAAGEMPIAPAINSFRKRLTLSLSSILVLLRRYARGSKPRRETAKY